MKFDSGGFTTGSRKELGLQSISLDYVRVSRGEDIPPADERLLDVVVLDMNCGVSNVGHDSLVLAVHESAASIPADLGLSARVLSFDVRRAEAFPEFDLGRFRLFIGTGGPGHLDPRLNDGAARWSEGIREDAGWEAPLFALYDRIRRDDATALFGFCHSFGLICRWSGAAEPVLRDEEKGGMSSGIVNYFLTPEAEAHPHFGRFVSELRDPPRFRVVDSRLFDLIPKSELPAGVVPLAWETQRDGSPGEALTMIELARDPAGVVPRIFAANHHPEVIDEQHMMNVLAQKVSRGEVTEEWARGKAAAINQAWTEPHAEERVRLASRYTLLMPLAHHLRRIAEARVGSRAR